MLRPLFAVCVLILLLLAFSFQFIEPGSEAYTIAVLTLIPTVLVMLGIVVLTMTGWEPPWDG